MSKESKEEVINPFIKENPIAVKKVNQYYWTQPIKGTKGQPFEMRSNYLIDLDSSCKVYRKKEFMDFIYDLKSSEYKFLFYIILNLKKGEETIFLKPKEMMEILGVSDKTYGNIRTKFQSLNVIRKKKGVAKGTYWVNPHYIYTISRPLELKNVYGDDAVSVVEEFRG